MKKPVLNAKFDVTLHPLQETETLVYQLKQKFPNVSVKALSGKVRVVGDFPGCTTEKQVSTLLAPYADVMHVEVLSSKTLLQEAYSLGIISSKELKAGKLLTSSQETSGGYSWIQKDWNDTGDLCYAYLNKSKDELWDIFKKTNSSEDVNEGSQYGGTLGYRWFWEGDSEYDWIVENHPEWQSPLGARDGYVVVTVEKLAAAGIPFTPTDYWVTIADDGGDIIQSIDWEHPGQPYDVDAVLKPVFMSSLDSVIVSSGADRPGVTDYLGPAEGVKETYLENEGEYYDSPEEAWQEVLDIAGEENPGWGNSFWGDPENQKAFGGGIESARTRRISSKADFSAEGSPYYKTPEGTYPITDGINNELLGYYDPGKGALCLFKGDYTLVSAEECGENYENLDRLEKELVPETAKDHGTVWEQHDGGEYIWWRFEEVTETPMSEEVFKSRFVTAEESTFAGRVAGTYTNDSYDWWNDYPGTGWIDVAMHAS